jgi:hypothetical protein
MFFQQINNWSLTAHFRQHDNFTCQDASGMGKRPETFINRSCSFSKPHHLLGKRGITLLLTYWCDNIYPLWCILPNCINHQLISLLTLPRNWNHDTTHNAIHYYLVVKWTTSGPDPVKVNPVLDCGCDILFDWTQVSHNCHLVLQKSNRYTYSLYELLRRVGEGLFCITVFFEIYEGFGS